MRLSCGGLSHKEHGHENNLSELSGGKDYGSRFCELVTVCNIDLLYPDTLVIELDLNQSDVN